MARKKIKRFSDGGPTAAEARRARKLADIESDYQKWLKSGRYGNADVARAKYDQRKADLADDYAKWTGGDRSNTRIDEQAAERRLSEARRTKGASMRASDQLIDQIGPKIDTAALSKGLDAIKTPPLTPTRRAAAPQPTRRPAPPSGGSGSSSSSSPSASRPAPSDLASRIASDLQNVTASAKANSRAPAAPAPAPQKAPAPASPRSSGTPSLFIGAAAARDQERNAPGRMSSDLAAMGRNYDAAGQETRARVAAQRAKMAAQRAKELAAQAEADRRANTPVPFSRWQEAGVDQQMPYQGGPNFPLKAMAKGGTVKKAKGGALKKKPAKKPVKKCGGGGMRYAKGGSIDGCAIRGHTRAKRSK